MSDEGKAPVGGGFNLGKVKVQESIDSGEGVWLHLRHPIDGHLLFTGSDADEYGRVSDDENPGNAKPCRVKVISTQSMRYRRIEFKINRETAKSRRRFDFEDADESTYEKAAALIVDMENVPDDTGRLLDGKSKDDKMILLKAARSFADQIVVAAEDSSLFFAKGSGARSPQESGKAG